MNVAVSSLALAALLAVLVASWSSATPAQLASAPDPQDAVAAPVTDGDGASSDAVVSGDFTPVARVASLMTGIGTAFSNIRELSATPDAEHRQARLGAWSELLAELSNVNTLHGRQQEYRDMAAHTRGLALELAGAARADRVDEARLAALVTRLDRSCSACHDSDF